MEQAQKLRQVEVMLQLFDRRAIVRFEQVVLRGQIAERLNQVLAGLTTDRARRIAFGLKSFADGAKKEIVLDRLFELAAFSYALLDRGLGRINVQQPAAPRFDHMFDVLGKLFKAIVTPAHHVDFQLRAPLNLVRENAFVDSYVVSVVSLQNA